jgi:phage-related protein
MNPKGLKKLDVLFAKNNQSQREPVREWLRSLPKYEKQRIGEDIMAVQYDWPVGMPLVRSLGKGLWEVRTNLGNRIARVIFFMDSNRMVLLHGFIKKEAKTPREDIEIAIKRKQAFVSGQSD